jgi:hypothetical protein
MNKILLYITDLKSGLFQRCLNYCVQYLLYCIWVPIISKRPSTGKEATATVQCVRPSSISWRNREDTSTLLNPQVLLHCLLHLSHLSQLDSALSMTIQKNSHPPPFFFFPTLCFPPSPATYLHTCFPSFNPLQYENHQFKGQYSCLIFHWLVLTSLWSCAINISYGKWLVTSP